MTFFCVPQRVYIDIHTQIGGDETYRSSCLIASYHQAATGFYHLDWSGALDTSALGQKWEKSDQIAACVYVFALMHT